jgi:hypothetical protein
MRSLVFSSLLFIIPLCVAVKNKLPILASVFGLLVLTSVVNHAKIYRPISLYVDQIVVRTVTSVLMICAFVVVAPYSPWLGISAGLCGVLAGYIYLNKNKMSHHVMLHVVGAVGFTLFVLGYSQIVKK